MPLKERGHEDGIEDEGVFQIGKTSGENIWISAAGSPAPWKYPGSYMKLSVGGTYDNKKRVDKLRNCEV